jgi:potassium-transporting ATPase KdpC subunit
MGAQSIRRQVLTSVLMLLVVTVALGFGYPFVVTGISQLLFRHQANGSLVYSKGKLTGSALLGQSFTSGGHPLPQFFQPRPSANDYNGADSGASNLGPNNPELLKTVAERTVAYRAFNHLPPGTSVPVDAVTASGSGLDPDISVQNALDQSGRVARARHVPASAVIALVRKYTTPSQWGFLSEPVVNVLDINLALETLKWRRT